MVLVKFVLDVKNGLAIYLKQLAIFLGPKKQDQPKLVCKKYLIHWHSQERQSGLKSGGAQRGGVGNFGVFSGDFHPKKPTYIYTFGAGQKKGGSTCTTGTTQNGALGDERFRPIHIFLENFIFLKTYTLQSISITSKI